MKILVFSDSHAGLRFMRFCIDALRPDHIVHLGDYFDDGQSIAQAYRHIPMHQVPGNCDRYRCQSWTPLTLCYPVGGVKLYMTHGHLQGVKSNTNRLLEEARLAKAQVVLYGHTHQAQCYQEPDGLWVLNPGSCGSDSGSVGVIEIREKKISACYLLSQTEIMDMISCQGQ